MLNTKTAKKVMKAVNKGDGVHYGDIINIDEAREMKLLPISPKGGYTVVGLQKGDMTILAWLKTVGDDEDEMSVIRVKFECW